MSKRLLLLIGYFCVISLLQAQIITVDPPFPTLDDTITLTFDATQGSGGLVGVSPVYIHTGLITDASTSPTDWKHVPTTWGVPNPAWEMTQIGPNLHEIRYHIRSFYNPPANVQAFRMAFVFRNADGKAEGKTAANGDIFYDLAIPGLDVQFFSPAVHSQLVNAGASLNVLAVANEAVQLNLYDNGVLLTQQSQADSLSYILTTANSGDHKIVIEAISSTETARDSFYYAVRETVPRAFPPAGTQLGATYLNDSTVRLYLYAPQKNNVYVQGSFNDYRYQATHQMTPTPDNNAYWIDLTLTPGEIYTYQYVVDESIFVADPFSELILNRGDDPFIPAVTYPNLPAFPAEVSVNSNVTVLQPGKPSYNWQVQNFTAPPQEELVVYELLLRDFIDRHDYQTLIDTLDYLDNLGINAIELMPINEFEGNNSWGYNPSFHMALDKYYGTQEDLKAFVDECHKRGIAVIVDIVLNHAFSQSPLCQLYWDEVNFRPAANNPYLNQVPRHDFNVGYDFNHESGPTQNWAERVIKYWLEEYRIDGYRFDLSKGFTQNNTLGNTFAWGQYDASRLAILKRMADWMWSVNPNAYVIMEHFAENREEQEMADYGMMLWNNQNGQFNEATMGYNSNLSGLSYKARNWTVPNLMSFMESHDEERLVYKNLQFGSSSGSYDVTDPITAVNRLEPAAVIFFTVPGPKMMWQFNELGYPFSINRCPDGTIDERCRVDPKPIRWDFFDEPARRRLYEVFKAMIDLKSNSPAFNTDDFQLDVNGKLKQVQLVHPDMDVVSMANFDGVDGTITANFSHTGWWYEYFSGDSLNVSNTNTPIDLPAGGYLLYADKPLPNVNINTSLDPAATIWANLWARFDAGEEAILAELNQQTPMSVRISLMDLQGRVVGQLYEGNEIELSIHWTVPADVSNGVYLLRIEGEQAHAAQKIVIQR